MDILTVCLAPTLQHTLVLDSCVAGSVNRARESYLDASGKGVNAARIAVQSGASAVHLTHSGGALAALFESLCGRDGIRLEAVHCATEIRICSTVVNSGSGHATELVEECPAVPPTAWRFLKERYCALLEGCGAVLISGKPAAGYPEGALPELARLASRAGKPLVLDLRGKELVESLPFKPVLCKPNAQELRDSYPILGFPARTSVAEAAAELSAKTGAAFLVTDGARPAVFAAKGKSESLAVEAVAALNPIGSGDACAAGAALALSRGASLEEACRQGLALGSRNATTIRPGRLPGF